MIKQMLDYKLLYKSWKKLGEVYNPPLHKRFSDFNNYINKIYMNGITYASIENENVLGMISFYANDIDSKTAFITQIIVDSNHQKSGIGNLLVGKCCEISASKGMSFVSLEVKKDNKNAISFYIKNGFSISDEKEQSYFMIKSLGDKND